MKIKKSRKFKQKAFTLIEILMVMGVIALIGAIGVYGLTRFRANIEVQTAFNDIFSLLKTLQNNARNSVSVNIGGNQFTPDYYSVKFENNNYTVYACNKSGPNIICPTNNALDTYRGIGIQNVTITYPAQQCEFIAFERLSGDIVDVRGGPNWDISGNTMCTILILNSVGDSRRIIVNLVNNTLEDAGI